MRARGSTIRHIVIALVILAQLALLGGAWRLHELSRQRMGVMRYLVARNHAAEETWFAPGAVVAQGAVLALVCVLAVALALWASRSGRAALGALGAWAAALAGLGSALALLGDAGEVRALYAAILVVWVSLVLQAVALAALAPPWSGRAEGG